MCEEYGKRGAQHRLSPHLVVGLASQRCELRMVLRAMQTGHEMGSVDVWDKLVRGSGGDRTWRAVTFAGMKGSRHAKQQSAEGRPSGFEGIAGLGWSDRPERSGAGKQRGWQTHGGQQSSGVEGFAVWARGQGKIGCTGRCG